MPNLLHSVTSPISSITNDSRDNIDAEVYQTNWEYLNDQLQRLDILIQIQLVKQQHSKPVGMFDNLRGLVISEEEINGLLQEDPITADESEIRTLQNSLSQLDSHIKMKRSASQNRQICLALPYLVRLFNLSAFEEQCLVICLAPELDRKYERLYAYLQDDVTRKKPSIDLILSLLLNTMEEKITARLTFAPQAPLMRFLLRVTDNAEETVPLISKFLKLDDRVVNYLLGFHDIDERLQDVARFVTPSDGPAQQLLMPEDAGWLHQTARSTMGGQWEGAGNRVVFYFYGPYGAGKKSLAALIGRDLGIPLIIADMQKILAAPASRRESWQLLGREVILQQAGLVIDNFQVLLDVQDKNSSDLRSLFEIIPALSPSTFLISDRPWKPGELVKGFTFIEREFTIPLEALRKQLWESLSKSHILAEEIDFAGLAGKFRFTPGQIIDSLVNAQDLALQHSHRKNRIEMADLYTACHNQSNQKLSALARKLNPQYLWDDIVLPPDQLLQLHELCNQVKYRRVVYGEWGFDRKLSLGKGLNALFSGPPGTGKTMAAEVIASELHLEIYKIDLSQVVSKYIGETEKNLDKIFSEAESSNAILFFDEADALFGKRSEVKDAHDRYANIEIGYLLQRMEEYQGMVILATNLNKNIDEAFLRRMHFVVEFPFPDVEQREAMWRKIFPENTPRSGDMDYGFLAARLKIAGGNIKNIALTSAFYAAGETGIIGMKHLLLATRREYQKIGKTFFKSDLEPYAKLLEVETDGSI